MTDLEILQHPLSKWGHYESSFRCDHTTNGARPAGGLVQWCLTGCFQQRRLGANAGGWVGGGFTRDRQLRRRYVYRCSRRFTEPILRLVSSHSDDDFVTRTREIEEANGHGSACGDPCGHLDVDLIQSGESWRVAEEQHFS